MKAKLLTLVTLAAMLVGGLTWPNTADARPWRYYGGYGGWYGPRAAYYYRPYRAYPYRYYGYRYGYPGYYGPGVYIGARPGFGFYW